MEVRELESGGIDVCEMKRRIELLEMESERMDVCEL